MFRGICDDADSNGLVLAGRIDKLGGMRIGVFLMIMLCTVMARADGPAPANDQSGLIMQVFRANRVMRSMRDPLPGARPDVVGVTRSLELESRDDFAGFDDLFYVLLTGSIWIDTEGEYTFSIDADDGADLTIDGTLLATDFWKPGGSEVGTGTISLAAGPHAIKIRMAEGDGGQYLRVRWKKPGAADFEPIPAAVLSFEPGDYSAAALPPDPAEIESHPFRAIYFTRGFASLRDDQAQILVDLLEGDTTFSETARDDFAAYLQQTNFDDLPYWNQAKVLTGFIGGWYSGSTRRRPVETRADFLISPAEPTQYDYWRGASADGFRQVVTIEGHEIEIFTPAADALERTSVAEALAGLPARFRRLVREVRVAPYGTASEFNGGGATIFVRLRNEASTPTLDAAFAHEAGHLFQHQVGYYDAWVEAAAADLLSVSEYGRRNPSEDFAEFNRLYISCEENPAQIGSLERLFPNRMKVYRQMLAKLDRIKQ